MTNSCSWYIWWSNWISTWSHFYCNIVSCCERVWTGSTDGRLDLNWLWFGNRFCSLSSLFNSFNIFNWFSNFKYQFWINVSFNFLLYSKRLWYYLVICKCWTIWLLLHVSFWSFSLVACWLTGLVISTTILIDFLLKDFILCLTILFIRYFLFLV